MSACIRPRLGLLCLFFVFGSIGCSSWSDSGQPSERVLSECVVEAACGECQFQMEGSGCDLAIRFEGKTYFVDGTSIDDHGDAHAADGLCNSIRYAKVSGTLRAGRFQARSFELVATGPQGTELR